MRKEIVSIVASGARVHPYTTPFISLQNHKGISVSFEFTNQVDNPITPTIILRDPSSGTQYTSRTLANFAGVGAQIYIVTIYPGVVESSFEQISMALPMDFAFSLSGAGSNTYSIYATLLP